MKCETCGRFTEKRETFMWGDHEVVEWYCGNCGLRTFEDLIERVHSSKPKVNEEGS